MNSHDLTREQWDQLAQTFARQLRYLRKLITRMSAEGFPHTDPLWTRTQAAFDKVQALWVHAHYQSCGMTGDSPGGPVEYPASDKRREPIQTPHPRHRSRRR